MRARASITVFSALAFWLIASFLFALLEIGRVSCLETYADMSASLAVESVCAEYQPGMWENYHLLGLDGAYGGTEFSTAYVTAVLRERLDKNLRGAGGGIFGLEQTAAETTGYRLFTDGGGETFLGCVAAYMKENLPMEAAQALYDRYTAGEAVETEGQLDESVESAQSAIDEARRQQEEAVAEADAGNEEPQSTQPPVGQTPAAAEEPPENPLEVVLSWKQHALLGMVVPESGTLSAKSIGLEDTVGRRSCRQGTMAGASEAGWYECILALEYADRYFSDYREPGENHALSYELEYLLCGRASDRDNLEGVAGRLLLFREAANVTYLLSDSGKRNEAHALAELLAGFTGNPVIVRVVQIGIIAAWAYIESILDVRALLDGDRIALVKQGNQWTSSLGSFSEVAGREHKAQNCENGLSYQDYLKGFLFFADRNEWSVRMMDLIEKNLRLAPDSQNFRIDHMICDLAFETEFSAEPLFWRWIAVSSPLLPEQNFWSRQEFSYYR